MIGGKNALRVRDSPHSLNAAGSVVEVERAFADFVCVSHTVIIIAYGSFGVKH